MSEVNRLGRRVTMRSGHAESLNRTVRERVNDVARCDLAHGFVERVDLVVAFALGRPDVFAEELLPEGLLVVDPPEVHRCSLVQTGARESEQGPGCIRNSYRNPARKQWK